MIFLLIGTCGAYWNGLLMFAYVRSFRAGDADFKTLHRTIFFIAVYELSFSLLALGHNAMGVIAVSVVCVVQLLVSRVSSQPDVKTAQMLRTYLPESQGPHAVGAVLALVALSPVILLCFTALREAPIWHKLLFTLPAPVSSYFAVSLLTNPRMRP